jgi:uncharacterized protein YecE (DUF72 family)
VVCEPRHASGFAPAADRVLAACCVGRMAADPAKVPKAMQPGGWLGPEGDGRGAVLYHRWHGAPRVYWPRYEQAWPQARAAELARWPVEADGWCLFDNTAAGAGIVNA